jgi:deoxyribodipyrimidine photo-lyase
VQSTKDCAIGIEDIRRTGAALAAGHSSHPAVPPVERAGGSRAGRQVLASFLDDRLPRYATHRNEPENDASSGLSPYLHHGHVSPHQVFADLACRQQWSPDRLADRASGSREGWWGMDPSAESFLDELITWRELGFNLCAHRSDYDDPDSLPDWARATLDDHAGDRRSHEYSFDEFREGATHDRLWNAAQRQLLAEGIIHNYLRMLWGKKILQWTPDWQTALETMIELNNAYAVDGCDPNSYSGIFWVLGRYDRAWGPQRPVFGKIRYMSSANTARKVRVRTYIEKHLKSSFK